MAEAKGLDCIVIGYNETPFAEYETAIRRYGEDAEAYRDLKFSFVELDGKKLSYVDLLNHVYRLAFGQGAVGPEIRSGDIPNLAAVYLTNFLRRRGHRASYINLFQYEKERLAECLAEKPCCVAITTTFYGLNDPVLEIVHFVRQHAPEVCIVVGGPLIANHVRRYQGNELSVVLDDIGADVYVVEGQGESTLAQIVERLKVGRDLSDVPNIIWPAPRGISLLRAGRYQMSPRAPEANPLDENIIDWREFADEPLGPTLQTRTARSCAYSCSFCAYPLRAGDLALASIDAITRELDTMAAVGAKQVIFIDDTFNVPLKRFKELCRRIIERRYGFEWFSYFRCSNSDEEAIDLMAESGCRGVFLGIESGSPTILKNMHKAATVEKYVDGMKRLKAHDILTFGSFIIGFPGETEQTVDETLAFLELTRPDYYRAQLWYCEPGTPIDARRDEFGISGQGFSWHHATMESLEAMDHIDRLFLSFKDSIWLPQWSFDFWIIPYLLGRGLERSRFDALMRLAHQLLSLEIAYVPLHEKRALQEGYVRQMVEELRRSEGARKGERS